MTEEDVRKQHETLVALRHYAYNEGYDAANIGYTGCNPYGTESPQAIISRGQWAKGYVAAVKDRLDTGTSALGPKP